MEPHNNVELPKVEGGFSNEQFEGFDFGSQQNYESPVNSQNAEIMKSREAVFSAAEQFAPQGENLQVAAPQVGQVLPTTQDLASAAQPISVPATASDNDLMEDVWVQELKKMIVETKNDPFIREVKFKEMQMDYLKKRYNRIINGGK
jgi:hypothetical protein